MIKLFAGLMFSVLLAGCSDGGSAGSFKPTDQATGDDGRVYPAQPRSCDIADMRQWVEANMLDYYLFYDQVVRPNLTDYSDLDQLISDMRVTPNDRFSYVADAEQSSAQFEEGIKFGFGHLVKVTAENELRVTHVYAGSAFDMASINRGDYIDTVNGISPFSLTTQTMRDFFGADNTPATLNFGIRSVSGQQRVLSLTSGQFAVDTVLVKNVFSRNGIDIGYLAFDSFLETSALELDVAFESFKENNIQELILDLRYNPGGRVDISNKLSSLIIGAGNRNRVFTTFSLNDKYESLNESINFSDETHALDLARLIVITTGSTCSASELLINGLRPYIDVVTIGSPTCGKPYGSIGRVACGKQMSALEFEFVNADNSGGYYDGLAADCSATDDLGRWLGDTQETMLSGALDYLENGTCLAQETSSDSLVDRYDPEISAVSEFQTSVPPTTKSTTDRLWRPFENYPNLISR